MIGLEFVDPVEVAFLCGRLLGGKVVGDRVFFSMLEYGLGGDECTKQYHDFARFSFPMVVRA